MNVEIKFLPDERDGLVATGSNLMDAARRLGIEITADCKGNGESDSCAIFVENGADLLSSPTESESLRLGLERLAAGERLACQTTLDKAGQVTIRLVAVEETVAKRDLSTEFSELPLGKKLTTLAEMEAITAFDALNTIIDLPFVAIGKLMDIAAKRGRSLHEQDLKRRTAAVSASPTTEDAGK